MAKALPTYSDPASRQKWGRLGVPNDVLKFLGAAAEIAASLAKVVPYVGAAIAVGEWLGILGSRGEETSIVDQRYFDTVAIYRAGLDQERHTKIGDAKDSIGQAHSRVNSYNRELNKFAKKGSDFDRWLTADHLQGSACEACAPAA